MVTAMSRRQNDQLLEALRTRNMTAIEIWRDLGIQRASARVHDLRNEGWDIRSSDIIVKNRHGVDCHVALYSLASTQRVLIPVAPGRGVLAA